MNTAYMTADTEPTNPPISNANRNGVIFRATILPDVVARVGQTRDNFEAKQMIENFAFTNNVTLIVK